MRKFTFICMGSFIWMTWFLKQSCSRIIALIARVGRTCVCLIRRSHTYLSFGECGRFDINAGIMHARMRAALSYRSIVFKSRSVTDAGPGPLALWDHYSSLGHTFNKLFGNLMSELTLIIFKVRDTAEWHHLSEKICCHTKSVKLQFKLNEVTPQVANVALFSSSLY